MSRIHFDTFHLDNGLKILIHETHDIPKVTVDIIYRVGAKDEDENRTGFAHLFEHLMFGGSKHIPQYDTPLQKVGGENNAFTTSDITNYYLSIPSNQLETAFWLESDRMMELDFSQKSLDVQKSVVMEEFKQRYLNQPYGDAHLLLRPVHFKKHPYKWSTIGKELSHIENATLDDVKEFFYGFYAPNNATLVVAGDANQDEVLQLAEKWFGSIPARKLKKKELPKEPPQTEARALTVHRDVPYAGVYKAYHIPERVSPEYYSLDLITDILSGSKSSHLYQSMVKEKQVASSIHAFSWGAYDPGMISIDGKVAEGKTVEEYESALAEVIVGLQNPDPEELQRIKNKAETTTVLEQTTIMNKAMALALADSLGDPELANLHLERYIAVTPEDVKASAAKYLRPENCSTLYYLPEK